ncbi:MAG: sugar kinase [Streptosporangiaceae bacterium]|jgi:2-dehydro-3-deoxygluconokinase|nr:sugar kinase [Streptosporangiaceae bacterium]
MVHAVDGRAEPPTRLDVLTVGETMASLRGKGPLRLGGNLTLSVAGAESNVAIGLARLGHSVRWAGVLGADEFGELVLRTLRAEGVEIDTVRVDAGAPTGLLVQEGRVADVVRVHYYRAGSAGSGLRPDDVTAALRQGAPRLIHVTGITPALGPEPRAAVEWGVRRAQELSVPVCLDVNYRSRLWQPAQAAAALRPLVPYLDIVVASPEELPLVADGEADEERAVRELLRAGVPEVVVKHGSGGARAWSRDGEVRSSALRVPVGGTVGAGDAFVAGYLSARLDGLSMERRLDRAVTTAAFAVAAEGDWEGLPGRAELPLLQAQDGATLR